MRLSVLVLAEPKNADWGHCLLFRRSCTNPDDWQAYVAFAPRNCDLETMVGVASSRWHVEHVFEMAKQKANLDDYEVRSTEGWRCGPWPCWWSCGLAGS